MNRTLIAAAIAALAIGFGGGFLAANGLPNGLFGNPGQTTTGNVQAAHGQPWSLFGHPRSSTAPRRGIPRPEGFTVWRTRLDTSGGQSLACVEMSGPLDPTRAYGDFVLVSPELPQAPAVSVNRSNTSELCLGGVGFTDRRVTLLRGLPAAGGRTLAANADVDFTFGERPPYVGFAGNGVILPREDADGVGIETINVSRLAVEVWRVPDRNLVRRSISAPEPTGEGQYADDYGDDSPDSEGRRVWSGHVNVAAGSDSSQRVTTVFPLGAVLRDMQAGGYVIKVRDASGGRSAVASGDNDEDGGDSGPPPAQARRWIIYTDMAVIGYSGQDSLDVVIRSLRTARTLPGLRVALVAANGESLGEGRSDASGHVAFPRALLQGQGASQPKMVMAYGPQSDLAVLDLDRSPVDLSRQGTGGRTTPAGDALDGRTTATPVDAYLYADRGIYRPGERVRLVAMLRDREARAISDRRGAIVIRRPSGVEFRRFAFTGSAGGAVTADIDLPRTSPRGRWTAQLVIDGFDQTAGELSFSVEDFAPQRLAVTATTDQTRPMVPGEDRTIAVNARFLYGAAGAALQTQGDARVRVDPNPFPQFDGYRWGNEISPYQERAISLASTVTDGEGRASLILPAAEIGDTTDPLVAAIAASVFEPGGRPIREGFNLKVRTRPLYLGVKVEPDDRGGDTPLMGLSIIGVNAAGQRVSAQGVTYSLIGETWSYDWFQQDGRWQYRSTSRDAVIMRGTLNINAAGDAARLSRRLGWGDYRLELTGADGARSVIRFTSGWGAPSSESESPDQVRVSAGTRTWRQGDTVEVTIRSPYPGQAQVAVATDHLIDLQTVQVPAGGTTVRLRTSAAWGGGAYVLATVIQPRDPAATPRPRRALGLVYVPLDPGRRRLTVAVGQLPTTLDSHAAVEIPIQVQGMGFGQRARVTVAAVDEGILRLTRQASPDPAGWYFGKRALSVEYRDDYGRLLDPNLGAAASYGGDSLGGEGLTTTPIRTVALWSGVVQTGVDGRATVRFPAADFNGELRIMAVAWTDDGVGSTSRPLTVRQPVVADLNLPRFLAPGDRATATLELHNITGQPGAYTAQTTATGGITAVFRQVFNLIRDQRIAERIGFTAPSTTGVGSIGFNVTGPGFNETKSYPIQTRLGWGPVTRAYLAAQRPGETYVPDAALLSPMAAGDINMQVSYSPFRGFDPAPIALALQRYPYGCTEQLVSVAYPLLYATEVSADPRLNRSSAALAQTVGQILDRQTVDGAFGLWRVGDGEADAWLGAYTTDFLIEAQRRGAPVPQAAIDRALLGMRAISRADSTPSVAYRLEYPPNWLATQQLSSEATTRMRSRASAYALYVMAKAGRGDLARLRWWHDVQLRNEASPLARAQIGAGLALMGDQARARDSFLQAVAALGYREGSDWYQSPLRDLAGVISLAYEARFDDIGRSLGPRLENAVTNPDALNTQEQARLLQAAHYMLAASGPIRITATGVTPWSAAGGVPRWFVGRPAAARFVNNGTGVLWRTVTVRGTPLTSPNASGDGLSVTKTYFSMSGAPVNPANVRQGDRVIVRISGQSQQARSIALAVNDALPAGFEIETVLGADDAQNGAFRFLGDLTAADTQESRDDRYVAAMDLPGNGRFAFAYIARAVNPGDFFLPGTEALDMYRPTVAARSAPSRLVVTPAQ